MYNYQSSSLLILVLHNTTKQCAVFRHAGTTSSSSPLPNHHRPYGAPSRGPASEHLAPLVNGAWPGMSRTQLGPQVVFHSFLYARLLVTAGVKTNMGCSRTGTIPSAQRGAPPRPAPEGREGTYSPSNGWCLYTNTRWEKGDSGGGLQEAHGQGTKDPARAISQGLESPTPDNTH